MRMTLSVFGCLVIALTGLACSEKRPDGMPELHPTVLTFTQQGTPLPGAAVMLHSESESTRRWGCGGTTGPDGKIRLRTYGKHDGVAAGKFKITVSLVYSDAEDELKKHTSDSPEYKEIMTKFPPHEYIPRKYVKKDTTPLEIEIVPGKNTKTFDIPEKVRQPQAADL